MSATGAPPRDRLGETPESVAEHARRLGAVAETAEALRHTGGVARFVWRGLDGAARAWAIGGLHRQSGRPLVWVLPDAEHADTAREDLEFFLGGDAVFYFPEPETAPYEARSPHPGVIAQRMETLRALLDGRRGVVVTTVRALAQRVPDPSRLLRARLSARVGEPYDVEAFVGRLVALGYERHPMVSATGEFAVRGGIVDVFALGSEDPWRLEFDDRDLVSLRRFDPVSQRSVENLAHVEILPRFEVALCPDDLPAVHERLRAARGARELEVHADKAAVLDWGEIEEQGLLHEGVERLAGFYDQALTTLDAYLAADHVWVLDRPDRLHERAASLDEEVRRHHQDAREHYPLLSPPEELYAPGSAALDDGDRETLVLGGPSGGDTPEEPVDRAWSFSIRPPEAFGRRLDLLREHLERLHEAGLRVVVLCDNEGQRERLGELLGPNPAFLLVGLVSSGFTAPEAGLAVLTDHEIFDRPRRRARRRRRGAGLSLAELNALEPGDYVVHADHGVGVYRGLRRLVVDGQDTECLELSYAAGDKLFVPVTQLGLVGRYAAEEGTRPTLHRLGSTAWAKTKARAKKAIQEMAEALLQSYAQRHALPGHGFPPDTEWERELEASFIYEETPDQQRAIEDVKRDMQSERPMDRLICGDVGFGKTEVAVRAAFKAVTAGKQVAVLVPTTILAQQHYNTFRERLAGYPVRLEILSRFRTTREQKEVVEKLAAGEVDVAIGTHRLLSKDVHFRDLGLVVVDEEQRFGVAHKERLRQMRNQADVLTLTATPIPRTLHFSLSGARDMSLIETPPRDRQPVVTEIAEYSDELVVEALLREVDRGGQAFFVHNRVETIDVVAARLARLLPQLRFAIAHGQMRERALEQVMLDFYDRRSDVLVCTMIVENGLDLPNANTLIVDRAETLGLAQLYQLRGRVGRARARAHAYFLVPPRRALTEDAEKRLKILEAFDDLGSGFKIALQDLEIRGAGNLLGPEQHGFIAGLGFELYLKLLEEAIAELKGDEVERFVEPRLHADRAAFLPGSYVADDEQKLELYREIAAAKRVEKIDEIAAELVDRFGPLPPPARDLLELRRWRLLGARGRVTRIALDAGTLEATLDPPLSPKQLHALLAAVPFPIEFLSGREMGVRLRRPPEQIVESGRILLEALVACVNVREA